MIGQRIARKGYIRSLIPTFMILPNKYKQDGCYKMYRYATRADSAELSAKKLAIQPRIFHGFGLDLDSN